MDYFTFNNICNSIFKIIVKKSNHLARPKKRIEFIPIPGRTGDLITTDGSRDNLNIKINCYIDSEDDLIVEYIDRIDEWLNSYEGYKPLIFNDGTKFLGVFIGQIDIDKITDNLGEFELEFSCIPYKELL